MKKNNTFIKENSIKMENSKVQVKIFYNKGKLIESTGTYVGDFLNG